MRRILIAGIFLLGIGTLSAVFRAQKEPSFEPVITQPTPKEQESSEVPEPQEESKEAYKETTRVLEPIGTVLFTSQAPSARWDDPIFQNACEEASLLMAHAWATKLKLSTDKETIEKEIRNISSLAVKFFGTNTYDTSTKDTAELYRAYFHSDRVTVSPGISVDDLKKYIGEGSIVIAPFDGRLLKNPHYTSPGPEYHMLVIIGYDESKKEFITNDPGTRYGAGYHYDEDTLFRALGDYSTGHHLPRVGMPKTVIIVSREK